MPPVLFIWKTGGAFSCIIQPSVETTKGTLLGYPEQKHHRRDSNEKRPPHQGRTSVTPQTPRAHADFASSTRRQALSALANALGSSEKLANACELAIDRVERLLSGSDVLDPGIATHIEEMLGLGQGWLEKSYVTIDQDLVHRIMNRPAENIAKPVEVVMVAPAKLEPFVLQPPPAPGATDQAVITNKPEDDALYAVRTKNLILLTQQKGSKAVIARASKISEPVISGLTKLGKPLIAEKARKIELAIGLPGNWLDAEHASDNVPSSVLAILASGNRPGRPSRQPAAPSFSSSAATPAGKPVPALPAEIAPPPPARQQPERSDDSQGPTTLAKAYAKLILLQSASGQLPDTRITELIEGLLADN